MALVRDTIEAAGRTASTRGEVDHAVRTHFEVRHVQRLAVNEVGGILHQPVRRAVTRQAHRHDPAARPIGLQEGVKVLPGIGVVVVELDADR